MKDGLKCSEALLDAIAGAASDYCCEFNDYADLDLTVRICSNSGWVKAEIVDLTDKRPEVLEPSQHKVKKSQ